MVEQLTVAVKSRSLTVSIGAVVQCHRGCAGVKVGWSKVHMHGLVVEPHVLSG